jgi:hypothetical protein
MKEEIRRTVGGNKRTGWNKPGAQLMVRKGQEGRNQGHSLW